MNLNPYPYWIGYSRTVLEVADRCSRLQRHMYRRGFHTAAFHVPEHYWEAMSRELWADPRDYQTAHQRSPHPAARRAPRHHRRARSAAVTEEQQYAPVPEGWVGPEWPPHVHRWGKPYYDPGTDSHAVYCRCGKTQRVRKFGLGSWAGVGVIS